ncbi:MAG: UDP-N-acetylmuramoyl-L-alanine--D-glutamate ligase [Bacillota bacterium]|nr:UDP-N-acetylmuramoyl-L-alanine--D-glutamate ligase [Bacillota bacterium]
MRVKNKKVLVLGGGKSGLSAGEFLLSKGAAVDLYDDSPEVKPAYREFPSMGLFLGEAPDISEKKYDFAVISPGMPLSNKVAAALKAHGVDILGELELASRFLKAPIIGITGTNGKTTTTTLVGEILQNAGYKVFVGGNIGTPLLNAVGGEYDYFVVEMSSFQLETISKLNARVSLFLNLTPDHLNRHGDMGGYLAAKGNLAKCQSRSNYTVLNFDDSSIASLEKDIRSQPVFFSQKETLYRGTFLQGNTIVYRYDSKDSSEMIMDKGDILLPGPHNLENAMGAITVAKLLNIDNKVIKNTLKKFKGVEHRMEKVCVIKGVTYVNDSKATNPDSVLKALVSYGEAPIILIAGGRNKGSCFDELTAVIKERVKYLVLVGECAEEMAASARKMEYESFEIVSNMDEAVKAAAAKANTGDIVLLSPANASFDQFSCFEERGEVFKDIVLKLKGRKTNGRTGKKETAT